jgi:hypothetical protein
VKGKKGNQSRFCFVRIERRRHWTVLQELGSQCMEE